MRTGECSKYKRTAVRISLIDFHAGKMLISVTDLGHIGEIKLRIHPLCIHIHSHCYNIHITSTLTIAEQSTFHTVCTCQKSHLCVSYAASSVVMRMQRYQYIFSVFQMFAHIFNLLCINMRHGMLYRYRQVDDRLSVCGRFPYFQNSITYFQCIFRFRSGKALRTVLKTIISTSFLRQLLQKFCSFYGDLKNLFL